jgi:hypothetical protein
MAKGVSARRKAALKAKQRRRAARRKGLLKPRKPGGHSKAMRISHVVTQ